MRASIGVLTPLIIGVATGKIEYGSYAALGALPAGFVSFRGVSRTRVVAVLCAAVGMAISTFVGATAADALPWLLVPIVFAWAYLSGLLASLGPTVLAVTLQWPVALLIASALPLSPGPAALRAGLVLTGGLWQCASRRHLVDYQPGQRGADGARYHAHRARGLCGAGGRWPPGTA